MESHENKIAGGGFEFRIRRELKKVEEVMRKVTKFYNKISLGGYEAQRDKQEFGEMFTLLVMTENGIMKKQNEVEDEKEKSVYEELKRMVSDKKKELCQLVGPDTENPDPPMAS